MYVVAPMVGGGWQILRVDEGVALSVGMFADQGLAERARDLLNRHGLVDVPIPAGV